ncbi:major facilitator superfamily domain-containing protein [Aspergillus floccosus]
MTGKGSSESVSAPASPKEEPPYHILSKKQKWNLVIFVSMAGAFSPLSSNIYFPAIGTISSNLGVNDTLVALTITVYMVVQGIAPSIFGTFSDTCGRRITFTISLTIYTAANLALAFTSSYPMLMVLRGLQAAGMTGQAIGPIIGGALNSAWGFRSIFWLLFSMSVIVLSALLIFLPETQRSIAGNGSIPLSGFHKPLAYAIKPPAAWSEHQDLSVPTKPCSPVSWKKAFGPLKYILEKDIAALLAWGAVAYTAWSMVTSSKTTMLLLDFPSLTHWQIGLCFLPNGLGCICGSLGTSWLLDQSFRRVQERYKAEHGLSLEESVVGRSDFPYVQGRLRLMPFFSIVLSIALALYGPSFEFNDLRREFGPNIAAPLVLQFIIAFTATAIFNVNSTVLIDCFPDRPASATALNNLCRCLLGAAGVGAIQPLISAVRAMRAFFIVTGAVVLFMPLITTYITL